MTPKTKTIAAERAIGRGNRHVVGIGQAFVTAYQRAVREGLAQGPAYETTEEPAVDVFDLPEPKTTERPASDRMVKYVEDLANERDIPEEVRTGALLMIADHRAERAVLGFDVARAFINKYANAARKPRQSTPAAGTVERDGMYRNPATGEIFKLQFNRATGDGTRLYAKRLVIEVEPVREDGKIVTPAVVRFDYAAGAMRQIRPEWRMTIEEARSFGSLYGTCMRCGRTLTLESSIDAAMGRICASAKNW